jgi:uncharacterized protein
MDAKHADRAPSRRIKILSLSDTIVSFIYGSQVRRRFEGVDLVLGCGDLPYYYLEYVLDALDVPLYFVRGNHDRVVEYGSAGQRTFPHGAIDLHRRSVHIKGMLLAGVEGSLRYRPGSFQYSQGEMWEHVFAHVPRLLINRVRYGRYLDIFVTHAPPAGIHDDIDLPHQGIRAFRWLISTFHPRFTFHGHVHVRRPDTIIETLVDGTRVINTYGFRETMIDIR